MKKKILLVDGMALLFRGFFATAFRGNFMKTTEGLPTNGIYQFLRYLFDAVHTFQPTHVIACWDMGAKTFRTDLYEGYKANRDEPPEELIPQFNLVKEVVEALDIPNIGLENYEADDCIGSLANVLKRSANVIILTGDQDMLQLVDDGVDVAIMRKGQGNYEVFNFENFYTKKAIMPEQIIDLKGLMGDSADNYPGVKGIGEKTALKLLQEYGTVDELLKNVEELPKGVQTKIKQNSDMLHLSRQLAAIKCDVPIECAIEDASWKLDRERAKGIFERLEFKNMDKLLPAT